MTELAIVGVNWPWLDSVLPSGVARCGYRECLSRQDLAKPAASSQSKLIQNIGIVERRTVYHLQSRGKTL